MADPFELDLTDAGAVVEVERQLATAFDGVDFEAGGEDGWARAVLRNLLVDTRFHLERP